MPIIEETYERRVKKAAQAKRDARFLEICNRKRADKGLPPFASVQEALKPASVTPLADEKKEKLRIIAEREATAKVSHMQEEARASLARLRLAELAEKKRAAMELPDDEEDEKEDHDQEKIAQLSAEISHLGETEKNIDNEHAPQESTLISPDYFLTENQIHEQFFPSWNLARLRHEIQNLLATPEGIERHNHDKLSDYFLEKTRPRKAMHYNLDLVLAIQKKFPKPAERPPGAESLKAITKILLADSEIQPLTAEIGDFSYPTVYKIAADLVIQNPAWEVLCAGSGPDGTITVYRQEMYQPIRNELLIYLQEKKFNRTPIYPDLPLALPEQPPTEALTKKGICREYSAAGVTEGDVDRAAKKVLATGKSIHDLGLHCLGPKKQPAWYFYRSSVQLMEPYLTLPLADPGDETEASLLARQKISSIALTDILKKIAISRGTLIKSLWQEKKDKERRLPNTFLPATIVQQINEYLSQKNTISL